MNFNEVRKLTITALFSDDILFDCLVLKGGNAMSLVLGISPRVSLDLDFSIEADFDDLPGITVRIEHALSERFRSVGFVVFDAKMTRKPSTGDAPAWWGGYELRFKLIDENRYRSFASNRDRLRREAFVLGPAQQKVFTADFSKSEYTRGKVRAELDNYTIYIYPPAMIALEKLRAVCQQMEDYAQTGRTRRPRARDFFDIFTIVSKTNFRFDNPENRELIGFIFDAKQVPLSLLKKLASQRDYHRDDWPNVQLSDSGRLEEFDHYFDFVLQQIEVLHHALGIE